MLKTCEVQKTKRGQGEHREQVTFFDWVRLERKLAPNMEVRKALKLCYAVPNGASFKRVQNQHGIWYSQTGAKMKAEGVTKGILDVNLDWPIHAGKEDDWAAMLLGLRIEHKYRAKSSDKIKAKILTGNYLVDLSKEQKEKRELLIEAGYKVVVSYSAVQSVRAVFEYLPFEVNDYSAIKGFL